MSRDVALSQTEEEVLEFTRRILGKNLAYFLLRGLKEEQYTNSRVFTALGDPQSGYQSTYQFEISNQSLEGLPIGLDPLVFAVLLNQLWMLDGRNSEVTFLDEDILEQLKWPYTTKFRLNIHRAIRRYFSTSYYRIDDSLPESERIDGRFSHCRKLLVGYDITNEYQPDNSAGEYRSTIVRFAPDLMDGISSNHKYFFDIDFESLQSIRQIS